MTLREKLKDRRAVLGAKHPVVLQLEAQIRKQERDHVRRVRGGGNGPAADPDPATHTEGWAVYFIHAPVLDRIKIGFSGSVAKRYAQLRGCAPEDYTFLGWIPGGVAAERALHAKLRAHRAHGEWFNRTPEVERELARFGVTIRDPLLS